MEKKMRKDLELVNRYQREITLLGQMNALLDWDEQVNLPHDGISARAEQSSMLSGLAHEKIVSDELFDAVKRLRAKSLKGKDKVMIEKLYKQISNSRKLTKEFVMALSKATTLGSQAWRRARKENNFEVFRPYLEKIIELKREQARRIGLPGHLYNSLLDDYEEGMSVEKLKPIFDRLKEDLIGLLRKIESSSIYKKQKRNLTKKKFSQDIQMEFVRDVSERMGLQKNFSRIDLSEHPFTTKTGVGDIRFTTNFREDPLFSFSSTVHEAGHALYESGMPEKEAYNILGDSPSLGLHESQSRFWENMIGKNMPFWKYYFPLFNKKFGLKAGKNGLEEWFREVNFVFPGKIRIESDEVHYCLHVILRFEIEIGLIDGSIQVKDLPKIWNAKMKEMFGLNVKNYVEGVLQDVHWSGGNIGYFPTYAIGTMYAAQIYDALKKAHAGIEKDIAKGDFSLIRKWLKEKVHRHGSLYFADELVKKVTGKGLSPEVYVSYLNEKYGKIYGF